jgi:citrate lyase subunit beta/citryl-CoA lyase
MPASSERVLSKGPDSDADAIIVDLEDSVAPAAKDDARQQAVSALSTFDYGHRIRALRINAADTPWFAQDIEAVLACRPSAVVLPKVESDFDVQRLSAALDRHADAGDVAIWAMMESPRAVVNAASIAASVNDCPRLALLLVGNNDLARAAGMPVTSDRTHLLPWLMTFIAAAKAHELGILDGVYNDFADVDGFRHECRQAVAMGMNGKTLIHPSQVAIANDVFLPSAEDIAMARAIVAAFADPHNAQAGVLQINGRMVERLHLGMAEKLLARVSHFTHRDDAG